MNKINNDRQKQIDTASKNLSFEVFSNMIVDGWKLSFQNRIRQLLNEHPEASKTNDTCFEKPWETYNLFTGYKRRFYFSDNPVESAEKYFALNCQYVQEKTDSAHKEPQKEAR